MSSFGSGMAYRCLHVRQKLTIRTRRRSQHLPAASSIRHDHSTLNPQSKPRPRAGVRGLRRSPKMKTLVLSLVIFQMCFATQGRAIQANDPFALAEKSLMADEDLQFQIPKDDRKGSGVRIEVEKTGRNEVTLKLLNDSTATVFIPGHGLKSPFYVAEIFADNQWTFDPSHMNCGTGAYLAPLAAGQWFRFMVKLPDGAGPVRIRVQVEGEADQEGNRRTTEVCTDPIQKSGEQE